MTMNRKTAGIALMVAAIVAFPAILFAEDISLETVITWVEEIAFEQDRQSERLDDIERRLTAVEDRLHHSNTGMSAPDPRGSDLETYAPACNYGVSYPWAGTLWNRSSRDMKMRGFVHISNDKYETRTYTLGPGQDSRDTDMCDVDHVKHDISPPSKWRYFLVDKNIGDWAKVSVARVICNDPPGNQSSKYGVKCG